VGPCNLSADFHMQKVAEAKRNELTVRPLLISNQRYVMKMENETIKILSDTINVYLV
jgi:hypothetical protein